jgi:hypothetical protein
VSDHLRLVEDSERPDLPGSLAEVAVRLVVAREAVRLMRRDMLLRARECGFLAAECVLDDERAAYALYGMRLAYRRSARMIRPFDSDRRR